MASTAISKSRNALLHRRKRNQRPIPNGANRRIRAPKSTVWTTLLWTVALLLMGGPLWNTPSSSSSSSSDSSQVGSWIVLFPVATSFAWALEVVADDLEDTEDAPPHHHRSSSSSSSERLAQSVKDRASATAGGGDAKLERTLISKSRKSSSSQNNNKQETPLTLNQIFIKAGKRSLGGGIPGALAGAVQVITLMWVRTIINHQSRYGTTFSQSFRILQKEGGIRRFYRGLGFALIQAPMSRFVSTAANDGVESFLANMEFTKLWGPGPSTLVASLVVGFWRMMLMPIDTCKTVLQVDSVEGFRSLMRRVKAGKIGVLYEGAIANALSSIVGHFPWFFVYNALSKSVVVQEMIPYKLLRNAGIGFVASIISDTVVNAIRVVKTAKQAMGSKYSVSYLEIINGIVAADGWRGLFGRGLQTRIMANAMQSIVFTIIWRGLAERWQGKASDSPRESGTAEKAR